jgi:hypothetical protein
VTVDKLGSLERWSRLRLWFVGAFALVGVAGIVWLLAHGLRKQEVLAVDGLLMGLLLTSLGVAAAELRGLENSKRALRIARASGTPPPKGETWVSLVSEHLAELASASPGSAAADERESLPSGADLVDSIRGEAERAAVTLRWFAGAAVLVGLLGTLFGLIDAIRGAVFVLEGAASEHAQDSVDSLQRLSGALGPLGSAFGCSGAGVLASLLLLLVRQTYESELDAHFSAIERWLDTTIPSRFPRWRSQAARMLSVAEVIRTNHEEALRKTDEVLDEVMAKAIGAIASQLAPIGDQVAQAATRGLQASSAQILGQLTAARRDEHDQLDKAVKALTAEHRGAVQLHLDGLMAKLSAEQGSRLDQWKGAIEKHEARLAGTQKAAMDERRALQQEYEKIRESFDAEFRALSQSTRGQREEMLAANASLREIGVHLAGASETLRSDAGAFAKAAGGITTAAETKLLQFGETLAASAQLAAKAAERGIVEATESAKAGLTAALETSQRGITEATASAKAGLTAAIETSQRGITQANESAKAGLTAVFETSQRGITEANESAKAGLTAAIGSTQRGMVEATESVKAGLTAAIETSQRGITEAAESAKTGLTATIDASQEALISAISASQGSLTSAINASQGALTSAIDASQGTLTSAIETSQGALTTVIETSQGALTSALERSGQALDESGAGLAASTSALQTAASQFHASLVDAIQNNQQEASAALAALNVRLGSELENASARMFNEALREQATLVTSIAAQLAGSQAGAASLGEVASLFQGSVSKLSKETAQFAAASEKLAAAAAKAAKGAHESAEAAKPIFAEQSRLSGDVDLLHQALVGVTQQMQTATAQAEAQSKSLAQLVRSLDEQEKRRSEGLAALTSSVLALGPDRTDPPDGPKAKAAKAEKT